MAGRDRHYYTPGSYRAGGSPGGPPPGGGRNSGRLQRGKNLTLLLAGALALAALAGTTLMYLTRLTPEKTNAFSVGDTSVEIVEPGVDPGNVPWGANAKPVQLKSPGSADNVPGVVRAMIVPVLTEKSTGKVLSGNLGALGAPSGNTLVLGDITLHFAADWNTNWFYKDGYFYYRKVLSPGETTPLLLTGVTLSAGVSAEEYKNISVKIDVLADILQASGTAAADEWGVTVNGSNVTP